MSTRRPPLSLREALLVGLCAVAFVVLRTVLRLPVHLPGHNAALFTFFLLLAAGAVGRAPAGAALGAAAGLLALVAGIGTADGPFVVLRYLLPGLALDVALVAGADPCRRTWRGALAGALAGLLKLAVSLGWAALVGQPLAWLAAKAAVAGPVHALSGAVGGVAAAALVGRLRRAGLAPEARA
ncbi:MAG: hypothetical protein ABIO70_00645 [Pseudomonadota bacterium]